MRGINRVFAALVVALVFATASLVYGALPATEPCDSAGLGAGGVTWTVQDGSIVTNVSGFCKGTGAGGYRHSFDGGNTYANDQYCQFTYLGGSYAGCTLRSAGTGGSSRGYNILIGGAGSNRFEIYTAGTPSSIGANDVPTVSANDIVRFEISGSTLTIKYNGVTQATRTDSTYTSGSAGMMFYDTNAEIDDWEAGNLTSGATCTGGFLLRGVGGC
jgi:hypothetical protein